MSWGNLAIAGAGLLGGWMASDSIEDAGNAAAASQDRAAQLGIDETRRQFDAIQNLLKPYVEAGAPALAGQQALLGLGGADAQRQAISGIESSPMFGAMAQQGENAILANASATGGLRGGNTQAALGQFRPALLNQLIEQQYARLGGITSLGQNAAVGVGNAGMTTGTNVSQLLQQQGAAQAGGALASGRAQAGLGNAISGAAGMFAGLGGFGGLSGAAPAYDAGALRSAPSIGVPRSGGYMDFNYQQTPVQVPAVQIPGF